MVFPTYQQWCSVGRRCPHHTGFSAGVAHPPWYYWQHDQAFLEVLLPLTRIQSIEQRRIFFKPFVVSWQDRNVFSNKRQSPSLSIWMWTLALTVRPAESEKTESGMCLAQCLVRLSLDKKIAFNLIGIIVFQNRTGDVMFWDTSPELLKCTSK